MGFVAVNILYQIYQVFRWSEEMHFKISNRPRRGSVHAAGICSEKVSHKRSIRFERPRWLLGLTRGYYCVNTSGTLRHFAVYSWCTLDLFYVTTSPLHLGCIQRPARLTAKALMLTYHYSESECVDSKCKMYTPQSALTNPSQWSQSVYVHVLYTVAHIVISCC